MCRLLSIQWVGESVGVSVVHDTVTDNASRVLPRVVHAPTSGQNVIQLGQTNTIELLLDPDTLYHRMIPGEGWGEDAVPAGPPQ
jgi:hypothetical protein